MSLCDSPSQATDRVRIGGISTLVAQRTRRIAREILSDDGRTDGEGCGQGYKIRGYLRRGGFSYMGSPYGSQRDIDIFQLNPVSKAVFGLASVTFEVRVRH